MVFGAIATFALRVVRGLSNAWFLLEAQRWVFQRLVKRTAPRLLAKAEDDLLRAAVGNYDQLRHDHTPLGKSGLHLHTIIVGDQANPPAVLIHGHSMSAALYCRNFDDLLDMGYCVYAVDLLGWGRSDRPPYTGSSADETVDWYVSSFDAWRRENNLDRFVLIGHSLGAYIAMEFAYRFPDVPSELVMISPAAIQPEVSLYRGFYFSLPPQVVIRRGGFLGLLLFWLKYPRTPEYNTPPQVFNYVFHLAAQYGGSGDNAATTFIKWKNWWTPRCERPLLDRLRPINVPVHLLAGGKDLLVPPESVLRLYNALSEIKANVTVQVIEQSDHCPHLEYPERFAAFLRKRLGHSLA